MNPESPAFVWDAQRAASLVQQFVAGRTLTDYVDDPMLRSAVERQFQIIGDALRVGGLIEVLDQLLNGVGPP